MKETFDHVLTQYGQRAAIERRGTGESLPVLAFIQPILQERESAPFSVTPLGAVSRQQWLYIGSGGAALFPGDGVTCGNLALTVQEARPVYCGDTLLYHWALLRRHKEAAV